MNTCHGAPRQMPRGKGGGGARFRGSLANDALWKDFQSMMNNEEGIRGYEMKASQLSAIQSRMEMRLNDSIALELRFAQTVEDWFDEWMATAESN
ncbi:hypothetical protein CEXT_400431 [Caerostris extrusa]|uniref:Uncharacterized protein n=1 Tax=Caerostris extrusa TaxID=172846 RepID=A0AAV4Q697_CAEEX|nr:hypothetical protein CEXT_400431 [Caerostris extrusa]